LNNIRDKLLKRLGENLLHAPTNEEVDIEFELTVDSITHMLLCTILIETVDVGHRDYDSPPEYKNVNWVCSNLSVVSFDKNNNIIPSYKLEDEVEREVINYIKTIVK
jgi:hypothetical protein